MNKRQYFGQDGSDLTDRGLLKKYFTTFSLIHCILVKIDVVVFISSICWAECYHNWQDRENILLILFNVVRQLWVPPSYEKRDFFFPALSSYYPFTPGFHTFLLIHWITVQHSFIHWALLSCLPSVSLMNECYHIYLFTVHSLLIPLLFSCNI